MENPIKLGPYSGLVKNRIIRQDDYVDWRQFELADGVAIVTNAGRKLISNEGRIMDLLKDLNDYRSSSHGREISGTRNAICNGGNGTVYSLGSRSIAIKESNSGHSLHSALYRMDRLANVVENNLPGWVSVVDHYALVTTRNEREFMLMEKIDNGVTIQDFELFIEDGNARFPWITNIIERDFPNVNKSDFLKMNEQRNQVIDHIKDYADQNRERFTALLPDPNEANFLVTKLDRPIDGKKFKLWIIDQ